MKYRAVVAEFNLNRGLRHWKVQFVSLILFSLLPPFSSPFCCPPPLLSLLPPQYCLWKIYFWGRVDSLSNELDGSSPSVPMYKDTSYRINILLIPIQRTFYFKLMSLWINKFSTIVKIRIQKTIYFIDQICILQCQDVLPCSANREQPLGGIQLKSYQQIPIQASTCQTSTRRVNNSPLYDAYQIVLLLLVPFHQKSKNKTMDSANRPYK